MTEEQVRRVLDQVAVVEAGTPEAERIADLSDIVGVWDTDVFRASALVAGAARLFQLLLEVGHVVVLVDVALGLAQSDAVDDGLT